LNTFTMHFRKCVALVVREYTACSRKIPVTDVTGDMIVFYIHSLGGYVDLAQCIYVALCGKEANTEKSKLTVVDWLRHPNRITSVSS
jgi:hypothetical protein